VNEKPTDEERRSSSRQKGQFPRWGSKTIRPEVATAFLEEMTARNLMRLLWLIIAYLPISLWFFFYKRASLPDSPVEFWLYFDLVLAGLFLSLVVWARKSRGALGWKRGLVFAYSAYCLASMTGYYFSAYSEYGETQIYTLGIMMVSVLFRLPPREFLLLLLSNHAAYIILLRSTRPGFEQGLAAFVSGLDTLVIGCLAAHFLFSNEWREFLKGWLLGERNREMAAANTRLRQANEEMNEIMAIAAHDLRSPLINVKGLFDLLQDDPEWQKEPYRRVLLESSHACGSMLDLIRRLLDAHAVEHESEAPYYERLRATALLGRSVEKFRMRAERRGIRLRTELPCGDFEVITDALAMAHATDNLLANALRFSPEGGEVTAAISPREESFGGGFRIEITDEGPGIPEKERPRLFRKFFRGSVRAADGTAGTGLGLFIVARVAANLGGSVAYEAREPRGSVFRLEFPSPDLSAVRG